MKEQEVHSSADWMRSGADDGEIPRLHIRREF